MVKFAVCDDDYKMTEYISDKLYKYYPEECEIKKYTDGNSLLEDIWRESFDAFFLDVGMPSLDGFELAKQIRNTDDNAKIIFVTGKEQLAHLGYIYKAFRFVRKSRLDQELRETANSLSKSLASHDEYIYFRSCTGEIGVNIKTIRYIKADGHFLILYGLSEARIVDTLQGLEEILEKNGFIRIHKSFLVNIRYLYSVGSKTVKLSSGEELPISRKRITEVRKRVQDFRQFL